MHVCVELSEYWEVVSSRVNVEIIGEAVCMLNHWMCYLNWISGNMNVSTWTEPYYALLLYRHMSIFSDLFLFSVCGPCCLFQPGGTLSKHALYTILGYVFLLFAVSYPEYSLH